MVSACTTIPNPSHFRFENSWLLDPLFLTSTLPGWELRGASRGSVLDLAACIKGFRAAAKVWKREHRYTPHFDNNCRFIINLVDFLEELRLLSGHERDLRDDAKLQLAVSVRRTAAHWKQLGKFRAIKEGDENTRFFHARASHRYRRNFIRELQFGGDVVVDHAGKEAALHGFYKELLGCTRPMT
jgi:hypothetical protein